MRKFLNGIVALSVFVSTGAHAADWWFVSDAGRKPNQVIHFLDVSSVVEKGVIKSAWFYQINQSLDSKGIRKEKQRWKFDCSERKSGILAWVEYGNNDRMIGSEQVETWNQTMRDVVPESVGESKWKSVCEGVDANYYHLTNKTPEEFAAIFFRL